MVRDDLKARSIAALKAGDKETRSRLTGVLARFTEVEKEAGFAGWTEESEREVVARYVKALRSSVEDVAGTPLAVAYEAEVALLEPFLPQLLGEAETRALVEALLPEVRGLGQLMGRIMKDHKGKVDPALVRTIAEAHGLR